MTVTDKYKFRFKNNYMQGQDIDRLLGYSKSPVVPTNLSLTCIQIFPFTQRN